LFDIILELHVFKLLPLPWAAVSSPLLLAQRGREGNRAQPGLRGRF